MLKILILIFFSLYFNTCAAAERGTTATQQSATYVLWNIDTDTYITGNNDEKIRPMASITKLMSAYVLLTNNVDLEEEIVVAGKESSSRIRTGMKIARHKLLELSLIGSDNLATRTLAETYPGGYLNFIQQMNTLALTLGMTNTKFEDSTGLLAGNITNAHDLRKLVLAISPYGLVNNAANTTKITFNTLFTTNKSRKEIVVDVNNTNYFAGKLDLITAKTGFTSKAGRCLAMFFNYNGNKYLLIVLGATTSNERIKMVSNMIKHIQ